MRLLNTTSLELKEFVGKIPPYAILSHCWEDEEIVFSDLLELDCARKKKGFTKLNGACQQAVRDGFNWIWIDTCCIDKSSSSELSESINSMFAWYRDSSICYAYLADVDDLGFNFRKSKWFTRAWTLQELLAPKDAELDALLKPPSEYMQFFSKSWRSLGSRRHLRHKIAATTGIDEVYLTGRGLGTASISMRMAWAAHRQATRGEDIAYSLLGIFDVNMPLLYGEGKLKAFRRLQEEIIKISEDETIFAWEYTKASESKGYEGVFAEDPKHFRKARSLVPFTPEDSAVPYTLTHRGLRICLRIGVYEPHCIDLFNRYIRPTSSTVTANRIYAAALNCHVAHDFSHVVVIPLYLLTGNVWRRLSGLSSGVTSTTHLTRYNPIREIYIQTNNNPYLSKSVFRRHGFLFRRLPIGYVVRSAWPTWSWNANDRILQWKAPPYKNFLSHATLELVKPLTSHDSYLKLPDRSCATFGCTRKGESDEWEPWCFVVDLHSEPQEGDLERCHHRSKDQAPKMLESALTLQFASAKIKVEISQEVVLGQPMFVVDMDLTDMNVI